MESPFAIGTNLFRFQFNGSQCTLFVGSFVGMSGEKCVIQYKGQRFELGTATQVATDLHRAVLKGCAATLNLFTEDPDLGPDTASCMIMAISRAATNYIEMINPGWKKMLDEKDEQS